MRLINTQTLELKEFFTDIPDYAILSHTWGDEEVTFQDWEQNLEGAKQKRGFAKIENSCKQARKDGYGYLWCDTNCIDKKSSAELSEAINSMYAWYEKAGVCYAFLADIPSGAEERQRRKFCSSRWFTRGWTLQELLAPRELIFFADDWTPIGRRSALLKTISYITTIAEKYIGHDLSTASVSERMSWLSRRNTTRVEDLAYCMLGIFGINMPLLYGEGGRAFIRLQEEILRVSNDQTIFCWTWDDRFVPSAWVSMLSPSPRTFRDSGKCIESPWRYETSPYSMTNAGLSIKLPVHNMSSTDHSIPT